MLFIISTSEGGPQVARRAEAAAGAPYYQMVHIIVISIIYNIYIYIYCVYQL